jgi:hypothetical protein
MKFMFPGRQHDNDIRERVFDRFKRKIHRIFFHKYKKSVSSYLVIDEFIELYGFKNHKIQICQLRPLSRQDS